MESRVGDLELRIRTSSDRAESVVPVARDFVCRVLERCDELLEQRAPGRLVFMRELEMKWRAWDRALASIDEVEAVAADMAQALEADVRSMVESPQAAATVAVFDDEAHYRAEYLRAVSPESDEACWFFAPLAREGPAPGILARREHRALTEAVLARLARDGVAVEVLSRLPSAALANLAGALDVSSAILRLDDGTRVLSPGQRALAEVLQSRDRRGGANPAAQPMTRAANEERPSEPAPAPVEAIPIVETQYGGLFYLLSLALELEIGEALWTACIPESPFFMRMADAIIGADGSGDPAPRLFGGATPAAALTAVTVEQHSEAVRTILAAFVPALGRRPTAHPPRPHLSVAPVADARLLVATGWGSPFAWFAWPAGSADELREGLATFLSAWPPGAPRPSADPALASLDRSGRIEPLRRAGERPRIVAHEHDRYVTALLTQAAGSLAFLFAARAGDPGIDAARLTARYLAVPAHVAISNDGLDVGMPMDRIDLAVRRAGLDRDPGWVPWLNRTATFTFAD